MSVGDVVFETGHVDMIHDLQLDYYGKRLATASSDRSVKIWSLGEQQTLVAELKGHAGPVWRVSWAHPSFGSLIASCSYDQKVIVWREEANGTWSRIYERTMDSSVNAVAWAPLEFGLVLACGCSDSQILVVKYVEGQWNETLFPAHGGGVTCLSWGPALSSGSLTSKAASEFAAVPRLVSGGVDNAVRVWRFEADQWVQDPSFSYSPETGHSLCVRDVAWAPSIGLASGTIASCGDDQSVIIWVEKNTGEWQAKERLSFDEGTWRVSWSVMGNLLAVSYGENKVSMWKESLDGKWKTLSTMTGGSEGESKSS